MNSRTNPTRGIFSRLLSALLVLFSVSFFSCKKDEGKQGEKIIIALSILPQNYFARRIGGEKVAALVLAGPGQNPHNYEPSPRQMADLARAKVWVLSGVEFEISLRPKIEALFPNLKIIDGTAGVRFRSLEEHGYDDDDHEDEGIDRHTWLGSEPAKIMARHIRDALAAIDPEGSSFFAENCDDLIRGIDTEFALLKRSMAPLRGKTVFVYHPSFGYFLDEFGIVQRAVETGGKEPTPRQLGRLIEQARAEKAKAIFVQAQFPAESARAAAQAAGAEVISLDPLAEDWLANIRVMGAALKKAAEGEAL
jgi:zinc transport system substrate-binding protein